MTYLEEIACICNTFTDKRHLLILVAMTELCKESETSLCGR